MARNRPRKRGISLPVILGSAASALLLGVIGFVAYVYFFVPLDEDTGGEAIAQTSSGVAAGVTPTAIVLRGSSAAAARSPFSPSSTPPVGRGATGGGAAALAGQDRSFRSSLFPYFASQPDQWALRQGGLKIADLSVDVFLGPAQAGFTPSITIHAQPVPEGVSSEAFLLTNLQSLGNGGIQAKSQPESVPSGAKASMISYTASANGLRYNVDQVVFVQQGKGWVVTLSSPLSDSGACVAALRQFLSSFKTDAPTT